MVAPGGEKPGEVMERFQPAGIDGENLSPQLDRLFDVAFRRQHPGQLGEGPEVSRPGREHRPEVLGALRQPPLASLDDAQVEPRFDVRRLDGERRAQALGGRGEVPLLDQGLGQVAEGADFLGVDLERRPKELRSSGSGRRGRRRG